MSSFWRCPSCGTLGTGAAPPEPIANTIPLPPMAQADPLITQDHVCGDTPTVAASAACIPSASQPTDARAPAGYVIEGELGRGGMGVVYLARQSKLDRPCALKMILSGEHAGERERERFLTEAQAIARLQHPGIVQVFEVGEHQGHPFMALELCAGGSLDERLREKPPTASEAAALVRDLAVAMQAAHEAQVIHRDLKPANVLVAAASTPERSEQLKITDFGLAKRLDEDGQTQTGSVMGTPSYMPPEQACGAKTLTPAVDVYALGAILYTALTGRPPFRGASVAETIHQVLSQEPVAVRELNLGVPRDLETICHKCLQKEPAKRYAAAKDLADDLGRFLNGEPIKARPTGRAERTVKWVRRNPVVSALAAAVVLVLTAGVVVSGYFAFQASEEATKSARLAEAAQGAERVADARALTEAAAKKQAQQEKARADAKADEATAAEKKAEARAKAEAEARALAQRETRRAEGLLRRAEWLVYAGKLSLAQAAFAEGDTRLALQHLDECQWNLRGWEHRHLWTRFNGKLTFRGHTSTVDTVAFSPDGKRIVTGSHDKTAKVWDAETGRELLTLQGHTGPVIGVAFSPDGKRVVTGSSDQTAKVWNAEGGQEPLTLKGHTDEVGGVAFSPDGKRIVTGSHDKTAKVWDAETGREVLLLPRGGHCVAFSPDGQRIVAGTGTGRDQSVVVWDAATGKEILTARTPTVRFVALSPDGKWIATGGGDRTARVLDAKTGEMVTELTGHSYYVSSAAFSPDGQRIVCGSGRVDTHGKAMSGEARVWDVVTGKEVFTLQGHLGSVNGVAYSPDGQRILTGSFDGTAELWDAENGQTLLALKGDKGPVSSAAFSPDSKRIATSVQGIGATVWDTDTGRRILGLPRGGYNVAFSPDGQRILTGGIDNTARVWDAETGQEIRALTGHPSVVSHVAWSTDGKRLHTGGTDGTAKLWDAETGREVLTHMVGAANPVFSPDSKRILTGGADNTARVWDAETGRELLALKGHTESIPSVAWSPDGKRVLTGSNDNTARMWDAENGRELLTLKGHPQRVTSVAFTPDGKRIVTGSADDTMRVWDADMGQELLTLKGHADDVRSVTCSPDGKRIVTGSQDMTVKVWIAEPAQNARELKGAVGPVAWSPDGNHLVTGSYGDTPKVWDVNKGQEILALKVQEILALKVQGQSPTGFVLGVAFSPDGKRVFAWTFKGQVLAWSALDGTPVDPADPPARPAPGPARSPNGFWLAKPEQYTAHIIDTRMPATPRAWPLPALAERKRLHSEQAARAEKDGRWFAVAFHLGRLLLDDADNAELKQRRDTALKNVAP